MTETQIEKWITEGKELAFYTSYAWKKKRREVLTLDKQECQKCKARGKYRRATMVHHIKHLRDRPDLALSIWDILPDGTRKRQLISLCGDCHAEEHPEQMRQYRPKKLLTKERW